MDSTLDHKITTSIPEFQIVSYKVLKNKTGQDLRYSFQLDPGLPDMIFGATPKLTKVQEIFTPRFASISKTPN